MLVADVGGGRNAERDNLFTSRTWPSSHVQSRRAETDSISVAVLSRVPEDPRDLGQLKANTRTAVPSKGKRRVIECEDM